MTDFFRLATDLEGQGRYDEAFAALEQGNFGWRVTLDPERSLADYEQRLAYCRSVFVPGFFAAEKGGHPSDEPIFILGMPRSGSTLIEQILIAHPHVAGMGECAALPAAIAGQYPFPIHAAKLPKHWRALGDRYLAELKRLGRPRSRRVTDKTLYYYQSLGMLALMFPRATIIHAVRDPMDTCFSMYRRKFADDNFPTAYSLADVARHYVLYRRFMEHWAAVLPGRLVEVRHEALAAEPEAQIRRLLAAAKLPFDERCLRPHEAEERVKTGSVEQMADPINAAGVGRWRLYEKQLGPLIQALGPYARA